VPKMTVQFNGMDIPGYLSEPDMEEYDEPRGGIIVIQEWWGLTNDICEIADRYAIEGFLAFAPDLFHGAIATEPDEARKLAMSLERDVAAQEIDAAIDWMKQEIGVPRVGVVGYCMGGGLALGTAMRPTSNVDAVHVYYGGGMPSYDEIKNNVRVPVLGSYGAEDGGIPVEQVQELERALQDAGVEHEITIYEGAGHSFFNDTKPSYHEIAAMDSWMKSIPWFYRHLAGRNPGE
jgi:carboxymethylenebutenolidase